MKFEEFLMPPSEKQRMKIALEEEVEELQERLNVELQMNSVLRNALNGPLLSYSYLSSGLPFEVQTLVAELEMVEREIKWLERNVEKLKMNLYRETKLNKDGQFEQPRKHLETQLQKIEGRNDLEWITITQSHNKRRSLADRRFSLSSISDTQSCSSETSKEETAKRYLRIIRNKQNHSTDEVSSEEPNRLSEELLKCLISIFVKLNQTSTENELPIAANKNTINCIKSKGFSPKNTFSCKARSSITNDDRISQGSDSTESNVGPYKNFIQITRYSMKTAQLSHSYPSARKLRVLMQKLCYVDLSFLSNKQKLAFWINIYNASIMNAYLQYGLPNTPEGMLTLLNKAALNVGGIVLNALAIEHYLLRHPSDTKYDLTDEKEMLLRRAYGLRYPEPNITFALCRGNWSSPALRIYTPDEVVNQLGRAKVAYLEASIQVTNKRKVLLPKLLQWHMQDFADDLKSLIEWIYSQLPANGIIKRAIMECLYEDRKLPIVKMIEIVPYQYEFQYLLPIGEDTHEE